jgi:hypothetical protein
MNAEHISEPHAAVHKHPTTREDLREAQLELLRETRREYMLAAPMLDASHWNTAAFTDTLAHLIARHPQARVRIVTEDTEHLLAGCTRLVELTRRFSDRILIRRLGEPHHGLNSLFAVGDRGACLVQPDQEQTDATLDLHAPRAAAPWLQRFEEIWNASEPIPGLHGFRL